MKYIVRIQLKKIDMLESMKNRRTVRKYANLDIDDALLSELLEVAARASNTGICNFIVWW